MALELYTVMCKKCAREWRPRKIISYHADGRKCKCGAALSLDTVIIINPPTTMKMAMTAPKKKQGWHLMTELEYYQLATGTLPPGTLISKEETMLDHLKRTGQYDELPSVKEQNHKLE
jgi:hypothetical protein